MKNKLSYKKGFTLIELMVVIAIIAMLSSIVLAALSAAREQARIARAQVEMRTIINAIIIAQGEKSMPLVSLAPASNCGQCSCVDFTSSSCSAAWKLVLTQIEAGTNGLVTGLSKFDKDPWGNPWYIDANQGETHTSASCGSVDAFGVYGRSIPNLPVIPAAPTCP